MLIPCCLGRTFMSSMPQSTFEIDQLIMEYLRNRDLKNIKLLVLDIGCGRGKNGGIVKSNCLTSGLDCLLLGVDIWRPNLVTCNKIVRSYDSLILSDSLRLPFAKSSFDIIIATEILEHMKKEEGIIFLKDCEKLVKKGGFFIISTPQGEQAQDEINNNKWEKHISAWEKKELKDLNFIVIGSQLVIRKPFRIFIPIRSIPEKNSVLIKNFILFLLSAFSCLLPSISGKLIAYKIIK